MYEGRGFSDGLIDFANGVYLNDTVGIGGVSTPHMYFGYVDNYPFPDQTTVPTGTIAGIPKSIQEFHVRLLMFSRFWSRLRWHGTRLLMGWAIPSTSAEECFCYQSEVRQCVPRSRQT